MTEAASANTREPISTPGITLTPVQVDDLPSLSDLFGGELEICFQNALARVLWNAWDTSTPADAERLITMKLAFVPEADLKSTIYAIEAMDTKLAEPHLPKPSRMVFMRDRGTLKAGLRVGTREGVSVAADSVPHIDVSSLPTLSGLFGGYLDDAFRRELVRVLVNIDDRRAKLQHKRVITIQLSFQPDEERAALRYGLKKIEVKLAGTKAPKPATLYLEQEGNRLSAETEPGAFLVGPDGEVHKARQSSMNDEAN